MHDTIGSHGIVATIAGKSAVDEDDHEARCKVHQAGREADGEHLLHNVCLELVDAALEVDELALVAQHAHLPCQRDTLRQDGGYSSTLDAPTHTAKLDEAEVYLLEDKQGVEHRIDNHRGYGSPHGHFRVSDGTQQGIEAKVQVGKHVAQQDYLHILTSIADGGVAGPEEVEDGVEEQQCDGAENDTHHHIHHQGIAQYLLCRTIVFLPQLHRDEGRRTHTHHSTECCGYVHQGEGDGQSRQRQCIHAVSYKYAVDNVVERRGQHSYDRGYGILFQQLAHRLGTQFARNSLFCHPIIYLYFRSAKLRNS